MDAPDDDVAAGAQQHRLRRRLRRLVDEARVVRLERHVTDLHVVVERAVDAQLLERNLARVRPLEHQLLGNSVEAAFSSSQRDRNIEVLQDEEKSQDECDAIDTRNIARLFTFTSVQQYDTCIGNNPRVRL